MSALNLYDEVIKRHNAQPYHFNKQELPQVTSNSPICGDRFDFCFTLDNGVIKTAHFHGFGCAVSKASASVLCQTLEGKTLPEAKAIGHEFLQMLESDSPIPSFLSNPDFNSFLVVRDVPARYDCAALAWIEIRKYLASLSA